MKKIYLLGIMAAILLASCSLTQQVQKEKSSHADFTYSIEYIQGYPCLAITDLAKGHVSVGNDMSLVINDIVRWERIHSQDYIVVFSDYRGSWNAWDAKSGKFISLKAYTYEHAANAYIALSAN